MTAQTMLKFRHKFMIFRTQQSFVNSVMHVKICACKIYAQKLPHKLLRTAAQIIQILSKAKTIQVRQKRDSNFTKCKLNFKLLRHQIQHRTSHILNLNSNDASHRNCSSRKRSAGGQEKRHKDSLKVSVKDFGICDNSWETLAKNRSAWRSRDYQWSSQCRGQTTG